MAGNEIFKPLLQSVKGWIYFLLGTIATVIMGASIRGDWIMILVHFWKSSNKPEDDLISTNMENASFHKNLKNTSELFLSQYHLQNVHWFVTISVLVSMVSFYTIAGFLTWYFYIQRKDKATEWKCQPNKWLTEENARHEFIMGTVNMIMGGAMSGVIATYVLNGGYTSLYFHPEEKGVTYLLLSLPVVFVIIDGILYYAHRSFHIPVLYRHIHKWHHRYHSPTPFSATAMHPLEFITYQLIMASPIFLFPVYSGSYLFVILYQYYYGVIDHSGIMMNSVWPWQPPSIFHDNHHRYFHCNFGFNTYLWDWMNGTTHQKDRLYGEDIFGGKGKSVDSTSKAD